MAPALTDTTPLAPHYFMGHVDSRKASRELTSGQHPPLYNQLKPFEEYPSEITGVTVWKPEDYANNPERWVHPFSQEQIDEMSDAADKFLASKTPLTGISKVCRQGIDAQRLLTQ